MYQKSSSCVVSWPAHHLPIGEISRNHCLSREELTKTAFHTYVLRSRQHRLRCPKFLERIANQISYLVPSRLSDPGNLELLSRVALSALTLLAFFSSAAEGCTIANLREWLSRIVQLTGGKVEVVLNVIIGSFLSLDTNLY
ncbi:hypothetical protein AC579_3353 [Pseudocercospora musae]|uniref:Uncharacterized protein n=1 Tax=Pseudocercospora musae TaxID=113226 RepID=A0A139GVN4_9PEZI|nr:hypothetical protein AC579_3353 [Pseudocercospora musae]